MNNNKGQGSYWRSHGGGGGGCSETGVQQQKLKQNWQVVSKPSVTSDCHRPLFVGCKVTVTLLAVCSSTKSASGRGLTGEELRANVHVGLWS